MDIPIQKKKIHSISDVLKTFSAKDQNDGPLFLIFIHLEKNWESIVGAKWGAVSRPVGYKNQYLFVRLPSACHIQEINFEKEIFISKLNKFIGANKIHDIRWVL